MSKIKMYKLAEDPCFGQKYELISECEQCWIRNSCLICYRNRK